MFQAKEELLVDDLIVAFAKGLEFVLRKENKTKRNELEWSEEILLETASSALNTHWSQEYIYKQTQEYKDLCYIKSISQFLKADASAIKKIEALYRYLMKQEINLQNQDLEKNDKIVDLHQFKKNKKPGSVFKNNITYYLDSIYYEKHFLCFGEILKNKSDFALADYFDKGEMKMLLPT